MIPLFMKLVVSDRDTGKKNHNIHLWLPLFLIWVLLLPLIVLVLIVWAAIRVVAIVYPAALFPARVIQAAAMIIWKLNWLRIDVRSQGSRVVMHF